MPLPSLIPAIVSSIINSAADQITAAPVPPPGPAVGLLRTLPADSRVGMMAPPTTAGTVQIDGNIMALSPAAQIRSQMNLIVPPYSIQQPVVVRYLTDFTGAVWRVWILTPAELAASR
jgi:hypothetical protein